MIATVGENITLSTSLLLVETEVAERSSKADSITTSEQTAIDANGSANTPQPEKAKETEDKTAKPVKTEAAMSEPAKAKPEVKKLQQQSLDLGKDLFDNEQTDTQSDAYLAKIKQEQITEAPALDSTSDNSPDIQTKSETMSANSIIKVAVPDIGADSAKVIEILVNVGDSVSA